METGAHDKKANKQDQGRAKNPGSKSTGKLVCMMSGMTAGRHSMSRKMQFFAADLPVLLLRWYCSNILFPMDFPCPPGVFSIVRQSGSG